MRKKRVGRPNVPKIKTFAPGVSIRLVPADRKVIDDAVRKSGLRLSEWARKSLMHVASNDILIS
jgi:hypothetical protein